MSRDHFIGTLHEVTASVRVVERTLLGALSVTEMLLLLHLQQEKDGISQAELLKNESMPLAPGLSALLARLERRGLVARERNPQSRRSMLVALTVSGAKELEIAMRDVENKFLPRLRELAPKKQKALQDHLRVFRSSLFTTVSSRAASS